MVFDESQIRFLIRVGLALILAFGISFALTPLVKILAKKVGAMDIPKDERRMHTVPIPRLGGLAIFIAFLLAVFVFSKNVLDDSATKAMLLGSILIVILGIFDDIFSLKAPLKLLFQIAAACIVVFYGGCVIRYISNPFSSVPDAYFDLGEWGKLITVIWIVAITNSVNFIDGLDGLACGVCCISSVNMLVIALLVSERNVSIIMAALAGACGGFIPYNINPAKIFMGDTGSTFLGFILASVSIQGLFKSYAVISFAVPFLLLGVPIFDLCFAVIRRLAHGKNPMQADRGHVHHRLIDMGFSQKQSVAIAYVLSGVLGMAAVLLTSSSGAFKALIMLVAVFVVGFIGISVISIEKRKDNASNSIPNDNSAAESSEHSPDDSAVSQDK